MSTQTGLLTPRWRVGGLHGAVDDGEDPEGGRHQGQNEQHPNHGSILGGSRRPGPVVTEPSPSAGAAPDAST